MAKPIINISASKASTSTSSGGVSTANNLSVFGGNNFTTKVATEIGTIYSNRLDDLKILETIGTTNIHGYFMQILDPTLLYTESVSPDFNLYQNDSTSTELNISTMQITNGNYKASGFSVLLELWERYSSSSNTGVPEVEFDFTLFIMDKDGNLTQAGETKTLDCTNYYQGNNNDRFITISNSFDPVQLSTGDRLVMNIKGRGANNVNSANYFYIRFDDDPSHGIFNFTFA